MWHGNQRSALPQQRFNLLLALIFQGIQWTIAIDTHIKGSSLYDWGYYGAFPQTKYQSFGAKSPWPNLVQTSNRCDDGYIFIEPRGHFVDTPGPVILDNSGNLVWMQTRWGQAMDVKVQTFEGNDYITFWHGTDNGTFGEGSYIMLDQHYEVFKIVTPVGNFNGDLHEFRITDEGTALMTMYHRMPIDMSVYGIEQGWIFDSIFQEVDLTTGDLLFEWRASENYDIDESMAPLNGEGESPEKAFDFFHINSVDKDANGDYLISSRYMCAVACISHVDGAVLWQLGGENNSFKDLSDGAASNFSWNHHAAWYQNTTLTLFDNGSNGHQKNAKFSRGLMIDLDLQSMTATLLQQYVAPQQFLSPSQGSVQVLPNGNVFVGWGHVPAFTEFTMDGEVLCNTHIGPVHADTFGFVKNYRTFKYNWVGKPKTLPNIAMRPRQNSLFVSWNGATEVAKWMLQSGPKAQADGHTFSEHLTVRKSTFETQLRIPSDADTYVRAVALDKDGNILAISPAVSKHEQNPVKMMYAPPRERANPFYTAFTAIGFAFMSLLTAVYFRNHLRKGIKRVIYRGRSYKYQPLPAYS